MRVCVAVRVGQALLYQQFGDLFAVARRFRASRRAAACGLLQTVETGAIYKLKEYKFMGLFTSVFICPRSCQLLSRAARVFVCDRPRPLLRDSFWCSWGAGL